MDYPKFFNEIETIKLKDELSDFLGTFKDGIVEFSYLDVVKSAGHSCPTVAGAYLMAREGLKALYEDEIPKRGEYPPAFSVTYCDLSKSSFRLKNQEDVFQYIFSGFQVLVNSNCSGKAFLSPAILKAS